MLDKVIAREALILTGHKEIREGVSNILKFKHLPKQTHEYVDR